MKGKKIIAAALIALIVMSVLAPSASALAPGSGFRPPATGDSSVVIWIIIIAVAAVVLVILIITRKKQ